MAVRVSCLGHNNHDGKPTQYIRIVGNAIVWATVVDLSPPELLWQRIYVDAWFGQINDVEINSNGVYKCHGAIVLSVENGQSVENVDIHNNLIFDNDGSGLLFLRRGADADNACRNIAISNNVFYHNGFGAPTIGQEPCWITGGLYIYSTNARDVPITRNIFHQNRGFQMGCSELLLRDKHSWQEVAREKHIQILGNLIDGSNSIESPIKGDGYPPDQVDIYAVNGENAIFDDLLYKHAVNQDFRLRHSSPAVVGHHSIGVYALGAPSPSWWKQHFPPEFLHVRSIDICKRVTTFRQCKAVDLAIRDTDVIEPSS
jgi:hypothetical protein